MATGNQREVAPRFGYSMICEQSTPRQLIDNCRRAETVGFDFAMISDHFHPWLDSQGQSPFTWSVLGALAEVTQRIELTTGVTCPTLRYHPAVVAQAAATVQLMSGGRFVLGIGAGERLNEHVVGRGWPPVDVRHEMLVEAIEIMRRLWRGGFQAFRGRHLVLEDARLYTLPETPPVLAVAAGGPEAARLAGEHGDALVAVEASPELVAEFRRRGGEGKRAFGQIAVCWAEEEQRAVRTARELWRFAVPGWKVMAELPNPVSFDAATRSYRDDDVTALVPCGPDPARHVEAIRAFLDAGFTDIAVVQVGPEQEGFLRFWERELAPRLEGTGAASR
jgi:G6PDH family F420-dependent oxidoreductase